MFHNASHTISYLDVRRVDTTLAKHTLSTMNTENGTVIPVNLAGGHFIHFTADNIDINEGTLDGQNIFHAAQYAAWQRGPESVGVLQNITFTIGSNYSYGKCELWNHSFHNMDILYPPPYQRGITPFW